MVEPEIVARLDPQLVSQTVHQFLRLAEAYPEAAREMKILQIRDYTERAKDDPSLAYTNLLGATTIWSDVLERGSPIEHVYAGQVRIGEIVPSEHGLEAIITHEFGHIMERSPRQYREIGEVETDGYKLMEGGIEPAPCNYARKDPHEWWATTFTAALVLPHEQQSEAVQETARYLRAQSEIQRRHTGSFGKVAAPRVPATTTGVEPYHCPLMDDLVVWLRAAAASDATKKSARPTLRKDNPYHLPGGSPEGGRFTSADGAGGGGATANTTSTPRVVLGNGVPAIPNRKDAGDKPIPYPVGIETKWWSSNAEKEDFASDTKARVASEIGARVMAHLTPERVAQSYFVRDTYFDAANGLMDKLYLDKPETPKSLVAQAITADHLVTLTSAIHHNWALEADGDYPDAVILQRAAAEEFGLTKSYDHLTQYAGDVLAKPGLEEKYSEATAEVLKTLARAEYENTQNYFREHGITEVTLYRGFAVVGRQTSGDSVRCVNNPLSSWSTDYGVAANFAQRAQLRYEYGQARQYVASMRVPVNRIFSTWATGAGCMREYEMIVLGGDHDRADINKPSFKEPKKITKGYNEEQARVTLRKFNEHHDELGRFASGDSAGGEGVVKEPTGQTLAGLYTAYGKAENERGPSWQAEPPQWQAYTAARQAAEQAYFANKPMPQGNGRPATLASAPRDQLPFLVSEKINETNLEAVQAQKARVAVAIGAQMLKETTPERLAQSDIVQRAYYPLPELPNRFQHMDETRGLSGKDLEAADAKYEADQVAAVATKLRADGGAALASTMVANWSQTYAIQTSQAYSAQLAAADEFGLRAARDFITGYKGGVGSNYDYPGNEEVYRSFARAVYTLTQNDLAAKGITELTVSRGFTTNQSYFVPVGNNAALRTNPLSSWTQNGDIAKTFGDKEKNWQARDEYVATMKVPASRVWSSWQTGPGAMHESELILLGGEHDRARVEEAKVAKQKPTRFTEQATPTLRKDWNPEDHPRGVGEDGRGGEFVLAGGGESEKPPGPQSLVLTPGQPAVMSKTDPGRAQLYTKRYSEERDEKTFNQAAKALGAQMVTKLGVSKLATFPLVQRIYFAHPEGGYYNPEYEKTPPAQVEAAVRADGGAKMASRIIGSWGSSATSEDMMALHRAAAEEFGLTGTDSHLLESKARPITRADGSVYPGYDYTHNPTYDQNRELWQTYARVQYDQTQSYLKAQGITSLTVERGYSGPRQTTSVGTNATVDVNPLSSWTMDEWAANKFARTLTTSQTWTGYRASMTVPADRVFSTWRTGIGTMGESEIVLLGHQEDHAQVDMMGERHEVIHLASTEPESTAPDKSKLGHASPATLGTPEPALTTDVLDRTVRRDLFDQTKQALGAKMLERMGADQLAQYDYVRTVYRDGAPDQPGDTLTAQVQADGAKRLAGSLAKALDGELDMSESMGMQRAAATEFGLAASRTHLMDYDETLPADVKKDKVQETVAAAPVFRAYLRAAYDTTQAYLAQQGIKEVTIMRGFVSQQDHLVGPNTFVMNNPISAWTQNKADGEYGAGHSEPIYNGYVVSMKVPASRVLATWKTGAPAFLDSPIIILGGSHDRAFVEKRETTVRKEASLTLRKDNPYHLPSGSPEGGRFTSADGGGGAAAAATKMVDGKPGDLRTVPTEQRPFYTEAKMSVSDTRKAKAQAAAQVGARMVAELGAKKMSTGFLATYAYGDKAEKHITADGGAEMASYLTHAWSLEADGVSRTSVAIQRAAAEQFGLDESSKYLADHTPAYAHALSPTNWGPGDVEVFRSYVKAVYANTQEYLLAHGISEVTVSRGYKPLSDQQFGDNASVRNNPLSSWSQDDHIARKFASGALASITVPASRIFSTWKTGSGCPDESEVILLGGDKDRARIRPDWS